MTKGGREANLPPFLMLKSIAQKSFRRSDTKAFVRRGAQVVGPENYIRELERIGSVREVAAIPEPPEMKAPPLMAAGIPSSALQAAQVLPQAKSNESDDGERPKRKRRGRSSSQTRVSG